MEFLNKNTPKSYSAKIAFFTVIAFFVAILGASPATVAGIGVEGSSHAVKIVVHDAQQLNQALLTALPGHIIELADGEYDLGRPFYIQGKQGTAAQPIVVRAANRGKAIISGNSWILVDESSYIVIEGLKFTTEHPTSGGLRLQNTHHSRATRNHFALVEPQGKGDEPSRHWLMVTGVNSVWNRIDHNLFEGKRAVGNYVTIGGDDTQAAQHTRIDHNYFRDILNIGSNGSETIRIGTSNISRSDAFTVIEYNLFEKCNGEMEIISIKTGGNHIRYNTFLESEGTVTFRHGNGNSVYGNYFLGNQNPLTGGVRIYGADQKVYNNYFAELGGTGRRAAICFGAADVENQETVMDYWRVERALVAHNTFVNNRSNFVVAPENLPFTPKDSLVAGNLVTSNITGPLVSMHQSSDIQWIGNIMHYEPGGSIGIDVGPEGIENVDPKLTKGVNGYYIDNSSPAVDSAALPIAEAKADIEEKLRDEHPDIGAFEYAGYPLLRGPITPAQVGPDAVSIEPVALNSPNLYITALKLNGIRYPGAGWWGPIAVDVGATPTGELTDPVVLTAKVNGVEVFREGSTSAILTINEGELADGWHVLTVSAESGPFKDEKVMPFQVSNLHIESPALGEVCRGQKSLEIFQGIPEELVSGMRVAVSDRTIYEGAVKPLSLDTTELEDGVYRLEVVVWTKDGIATKTSTNFVVDNFWQLSDDLKPPDKSWFGVTDRSLTSATSKGWGYDTQNPDLFFADADRKLSTTQNEEWLMWDAPHLLEAVVTLYTTSVDAADNVVLAVSADGETWQTTDYELVSQGISPGGWHKLELKMEPEDANSVRFFRLALAESKPEATVQIGHVHLRGRETD